jgi:hypothetical protein
VSVFLSPKKCIFNVKVLPILYHPVCWATTVWLCATNIDNFFGSIFSKTSIPFR